MAQLLIVLFLVTFLFDTRVGLCFLAAAIAVLVYRAPARKRRAHFGEDPPMEQPAWKDPWGTSGVG